MRALLLLILAGSLAVVADGCMVFDPEQAKRNLAEQESKDAAKKARLDRILIMPGDLNRPYKVLGPIEASAGLVAGCSVQWLAMTALERYPDVDALIGVTTVAGGGFEPVIGGAIECRGTAVRFESK